MKKKAWRLLEQVQEITQRAEDEQRELTPSERQEAEGLIARAAPSLTPAAAFVASGSRVPPGSAPLTTFKRRRGRDGDGGECRRRIPPGDSL
jgi:hypothetical protein